MSKTRKTLIMALGAGVLALWALAGRAEAQPATSYYAPRYYRGRVVYYNTNGRPYYYQGGVARYIPTNYGYYNDLVNYYRARRHHYHRWYRTHGRRYHAYRIPYRATYYTPQYYDDYPVYYDAAGRPIYYVDGVRYYVPAGDPYYTTFVNHYRVHRHNYLRWYRDVGAHYRSYRRIVGRTAYYTPLYYSGYIVYYDNSGVPFYYHNGVRRYVPRTYGGYNRYVTHYRSHRTHYSRWHREHGHKYRRHYRPVRTTRVRVAPPVRHHTVRHPVRTHVVRRPVRHHTVRQPVRTHVVRRPVRTHVVRRPVRTHVVRRPVRTHVVRQPVRRTTVRRQPARRQPARRQPVRRQPVRRPVKRGRR